MINTRYCSQEGHIYKKAVRICTFNACPLQNKWVCEDCSFQLIHLHKQSNQDHIMKQDQFLQFIKQQTESILNQATEYTNKSTLAIKKVDQLIQNFTIFKDKLKNDQIVIQQQYNVREIQNITNIARNNYYLLESQQIQKIININNYHIQRNYQSSEHIFLQLIDQFKDLQQLLIINKEEEIKKMEQENKIIISYLTQNDKIIVSDFDPKSNRNWPLNYRQFELRGPKQDQIKYFYPRGWKGFALNVKGKYDGGNDDWLERNSNPNQWHIMYYMTNSGLFKQFDIRKQQMVGAGLYFSNHIEVLERKSQPIKIGDSLYHQVFQMRVRPSSLQQIQKDSDMQAKIGNPDWDNDHFLITKFEDVRPYRLLFKKVGKDIQGQYDQKLDQQGGIYYNNKQIVPLNKQFQKQHTRPIRSNRCQVTIKLKLFEYIILQSEDLLLFSKGNLTNITTENINTERKQVSYRWKEVLINKLARNINLTEKLVIFKLSQIDQFHQNQRNILKYLNYPVINLRNLSKNKVNQSSEFHNDYDQKQQQIGDIGLQVCKESKG
ncbi:hypothetical protein pb186bvf_003168 [Paramecium bursaria]